MKVTKEKAAELANAMQENNKAIVEAQAQMNKLRDIQRSLWWTIKAPLLLVNSLLDKIRLTYVCPICGNKDSYNKQMIRSHLLHVHPQGEIEIWLNENPDEDYCCC